MPPREVVLYLVVVTADSSSYAPYDDTIKGCMMYSITYGVVDNSTIKAVCFVTLKTYTQMFNKKADNLKVYQLPHHILTRPTVPVSQE